LTINTPSAIVCFVDLIGIKCEFGSVSFHCI